ncbi:apolipoprotein N-acyltransferase [candidate division WOR-3 bacterium RBG_13_43_14]|uniref:Apolipoprotein N-acyltransferase n=1 Tax=candidate division WOR-3 bacterium RBG_13_43_14 TaxID=1802590 RepID=A0A1F4U1C3_UNCW3|nr:MAG: apolipoprotein N-acyltransferase [candidate division WOR-3 bacterium RBG_13_43_14]
MEQEINKKNLIFIILAAIMSALAFHPIGLHFLAWFSVVPFMFAIENLKPSAAFKSGIIFGFFFALFSVFWIVFVETPSGIKILMVFGLLLMFLYFGIYYGIATLFARHTGWYSLPFILSGMEFIRGIGEIGFPWLSFGYSQARYPLIIQQASIYGIYGLSAWLFLVNVLLYKVLKCRKIKELIILMIIILLPISYGIFKLRDSSSSPYLGIGVIQPNIDPNLKFTRGMREETFRRLIEFSSQCAKQYYRDNNRRLDLIVWPETAIPVNLKTPGRYQDRVIELVEQIQVPVLSGSPLIEKQERAIYNGAILIIPGPGLVQEYRKLHLVPFGEHIPYEQRFPFLRNIDVSGGHYSPGTEYTIFQLDRYSFSCLICFESIFPEISRAYVRKGADFLVNITNDGWFGKISGSQQHNDMAILRTVENNVSLARSANTGISMLVDNKGRILTESGVFEEAYLSKDIPIANGSTMYNRVGDIIPLLSVLLIPIICLFKRMRYRNFWKTKNIGRRH